MNFIKDIFNRFKNADSLGKLSITSDIITIVTFFTAVILSPKILSIFYNFNPNTYFNVVMATTGSLLLILLFLTALLGIYDGEKYFWPRSPHWVKLLWIMIFIAALGSAVACIPALISVFFQMALQ